VSRVRFLIVVSVCGALAACGSAEPAADGAEQSGAQNASAAVDASVAPTGPTAQAVVDQFVASGLPAPHPRDNSKNCTTLGCAELITTDAISIYVWPTESSVQHQVDVAPGDSFRDETIVLSYAAARTPAADRPLYETALKSIAG
jgi:hypothetical protein